jgi:hypothetical protein
MTGTTRIAVVTISVLLVGSLLAVAAPATATYGDNVRLTAPVEADHGVTDGTVSGGTHDLVFATGGDVGEIVVTARSGWGADESVDRRDATQLELERAWSRTVSSRYETDVAAGQRQATVDDVSLAVGRNFLTVRVFDTSGAVVNEHEFELWVRDDAPPTADVVVEPMPNGERWRVVGEISDDVQVADANVTVDSSGYRRTEPVDRVPARDELAADTVSVNVAYLPAANVTLALTDTSGTTTTVDLQSTATQTSPKPATETATETATSTPTPTPTPTPAPTATVTPTPAPDSGGGGLVGTVVGVVLLLSILALANGVGGW